MGQNFEDLTGPQNPQIGISIFGTIMHHPMIGVASFDPYLVAHPTARKWAIYHPNCLSGLTMINPLQKSHLYITG